MAERHPSWRMVSRRRVSDGYSLAQIKAIHCQVSLSCS